MSSHIEWKLRIVSHGLFRSSDGLCRKRKSCSFFFFQKVSSGNPKMLHFKQCDFIFTVHSLLFVLKSVVFLHISWSFILTAVDFRAEERAFLRNHFSFSVSLPGLDQFIEEAGLWKTAVITPIQTGPNN